MKAIVGVFLAVVLMGLVWFLLDGGFQGRSL
jgi:hypothetical protein